MSGAVARLKNTAPGRRLLSPELSVVVPFYQVEAYLDECLRSLLDQTFADYEVILVDDGSRDGSRRIAEEYVARDRRFRLLTRPNGGLGAARNTGVRAARGRYLTFVDSDDVVPDNAWADLVGSARRTGSDLVVGNVVRFNSARTRFPTWTESVHAEARSSVTVSDFPALLRNLYTWNKVFRRDFWDAQGLWFREGVAYEDQPIITQLFARARGIDVLSEIVYHYRERDDRSSISQQTASLADLRDRISAWRVSRDVLRVELGPAGYDDWLVTLFDVHFHWYLTSPGTADDAYWDELVEVIGEFADQAPAAVWRRTSPYHRVLLDLALSGRRHDAQEFVRQQGNKLELWPSRLTADGVLVELPFWGDPELPESHFLLSPEQIKLWHSIENIHWRGSGSDLVCEINGQAYLEKVDLAEHPATISVVIDGPEADAQLEFPSVGESPSTLPFPTDDRWCDYGPGTFRVRVPWSEVDQALGKSWRLSLRIRVGELTVTRPMTSLLRRGAAGWVPAGVADGARVVLDWHLGGTVRLRMVERGAEVDRLRVDGRRVSGRVRSADGIRRVVAATSRSRVESAIDRDGRFTLELPAHPGPAAAASRVWTVSGRGRSGVLGPRLPLVPTSIPADVAGMESGPATGGAAGAAGGVSLETDRYAELAIRDAHLEVVADSIAPGPETESPALTVTGRVLGADDGTLRLRTNGIAGGAVSERVPVSRGRFQITLPLTHPVARFGDWALPPGPHNVSAQFIGRAVGDTGRWSELSFSHQVAEKLPVALARGQVQGQIVRGPQGQVQVQLRRPLGGVTGEYHQRRLRATVRPAGLTRAVLIRSYFGEKATDSGVAIAAELARRGSDLPVYWAVQGHWVPIPAGSRAVVVNSREWYELLNSASYYIDNMFQPEYHHKPAGQVLVQTFHGYPFKKMGLPHWEQQQFSRARVDSYLARIGDWDAVLSPATYATELLKRDFAFGGRMLEVGYPRNDILLAPQGQEIREITRAGLGIAPDQHAVLYAPTFRDYLAENDNWASWPRFFDFSRAREALGSDFVILVRGHAFNARSRYRVPLPDGCLDVTDYPEISDLYLAADSAVVDYSSLRFDFAITGKPMIFQVPDLDRYQATRGWLLPFDATAPGPMVATTEEVVAQLADQGALRADWAQSYRDFRGRYLDLDDGAAAARFVDAVFAPNGDA
ncbi:MAG: bifunctional glycosyltransferase/CDP-glycerol:glycerophosphate glycerophosphotransferase [Nocardioides sp.]